MECRPPSLFTTIRKLIHNPETHDPKPQPQSHPPAAPTAQEEETTIILTAERGYHIRQLLHKTQSTTQRVQTTLKGNLHIPRLGKERHENEAETLRFIRRVSGIPVPRLYGAAEVDGAYFLVMEFVEGVAMAQLREDQNGVVRAEIQRYLGTLHGIKARSIGGPSGLVIPLYRVMESTANEEWSLRPSEDCEYVFCHNDLSQSNVIVDLQTLKINAIIDWECAGFFLAYFEAPFYKRIGPSVALEGEHDDVPKLFRFLNQDT